MTDELIFDLKVLKFKLEECLNLYESSNNFLLISKNIITELCDFILNKEKQLIFFNLKKDKIIDNYIKDIRNLSSKLLGTIEKEETKLLLDDKNTYFKYGKDLEFNVLQEIYDFNITTNNNILFIGSGAMPITAFTISKNIKANITCLDIDLEALNLSKKLAEKLNLKNINFVKDINNIDFKNYTHIIIASLVELKCEILEKIKNLINNDTKIILRYGNEIKELFNYPLCEKEIKSFNKTVIRDRNYIYDSLLLEKEW